MKTLSIKIEEILAEHFNPTTRTEVRKKIIKAVKEWKEHVIGEDDKHEHDQPESYYADEGCYSCEVNDILENQRKRAEKTL